MVGHSDSARASETSSAAFTGGPVESFRTRLRSHTSMSPAGGSSIRTTVERVPISSGCPAILMRITMACIGPCLVVVLKSVDVQPEGRV